MPTLLEMEENDPASVTPCFTVQGVNYLLSPFPTLLDASRTG